MQKVVPFSLQISTGGDVDEGLARSFDKGAIPRRNRRAVGVKLRIAQRGCHAIFKLFGDGVFELLCLLVHEIPRNVQRFTQEQLD